MHEPFDLPHRRAYPRGTTIHLAREQGALIEKQLASGRYPSRADVIGEALQLLNDMAQLEEAKLARLRADVQQGLDSGGPTPLDLGAVKRAARRRRDKPQP